MSWKLMGLWHISPHNIHDSSSTTIQYSESTAFQTRHTDSTLTKCTLAQGIKEIDQQAHHTYVVMICFHNLSLDLAFL